MEKQRKGLLDIFQAALKAVSGQSVVKQEIETGNYPDEFHVISIGKAADAMLQGLPYEKIKTALVISKHGHISEKQQQDSRIICIESDHPVPQKNSLKAGEVLLDFIKKLPQGEPCIFLISGGASALVEVLEEGWDLPQLQELTDYLLANAYPINEINAIRRRLSKIKGGGLWRYLGDRSVYCLMISDVPDDDPAVIGSGLLFNELAISSFEMDDSIMSPLFGDEVELPKMPAKWADKLTPKTIIITPENFHWKIIASLALAKQAAAEKAKELGYQLKIIPEFMEGEASKTAVSCVNTIKKSPNTLFIWGGETTVYLPENAGKGGRNQHLALAAAIEMQGIKNTYLLAAGTDGSDGLTTATGAIVDGETVIRAEKLNLNADAYLKRADSNTFFQKTEGLIETGATGTNVMDLVLAIKKA